MGILREFWFKGVGWEISMENHLFSYEGHPFIVVVLRYLEYVARVLLEFSWILNDHCAKLAPDWPVKKRLKNMFQLTLRDWFFFIQKKMLSFSLLGLIWIDKGSPFVREHSMEESMLLLQFWCRWSAVRRDVLLNFIIHDSILSTEMATEFMFCIFTPPKFNMETDNDGFQKESPFPGTSFQVPC